MSSSNKSGAALSFSEWRENRSNNQKSTGRPSSSSTYRKDERTGSSPSTSFSDWREKRSEGLKSGGTSSDSWRVQQSQRSREEEIYNALTAGMQQNQAQDQTVSRTNAQRDQLVSDLQALRDTSGYVTDDVSLANYKQTEQRIIADLAKWDARLGNAPQDYSDKNDHLRVANTWGASASRSLAGLTNAAATVLAYENERRDPNYILENAIQSSDFATQMGQSGVDAFKQAMPDDKESYRVAGQDTIDNMQAAADTMRDDSNRMQAEAKEGLGTIGQGAVDVGMGLFDVAGDTALSFLAPGLGMVRMATSAFGSAAQEARLEGKSVDQQMFEGIKSAGIEVITEKIGGPFEKAYGSTLLGKSLDKGISKLSKNSVFMKFLLKSGANFFSEGGEEVMSNFLNTFVDRIMDTYAAGYYDKLLEAGRIRAMLENAQDKGLPTQELERQLRQAESEQKAIEEKLKETMPNYDLGEMFYEGLIGGLTGLIGGAGKAWTSSRIEAAVDRAVATVQAMQDAKSDVSQETAPEAAEEQVAPDDDVVLPFAMDEPTEAPDALNSNPGEQEAPLPFDDATNPPVQQETSLPPEQNGVTMEAPTQKGEIDNGKTEDRSNSPGRGEAANEVRPEQSEGSAGDRTAPEGGTASEAQTTPGGIRPDPEKAKRAEDRTNRVKSSVEKAAPGKSSGVTNAISRDRTFTGTISAEINDLLRNGVEGDRLHEAIDRAAVDDIISEIAETGDDSVLRDILTRVLGEGADVDSVINSILEGEEVAAKQEPAEAEMQQPKVEEQKPVEQEAPKVEQPKVPPQRATVEVKTDEKGRKYAEVSGNGSVTTVSKDVKAVKFGTEKYVPDDNDVVVSKNRKNKTIVIQRGSGNNYLVVNRKKQIIGTYDDYGHANAAAFGSSERYASAEVSLADRTRVWYEDGIVHAASEMFADKDVLTSRNRSQASDDLGTILSTYKDVAVTTDYFTIDFSEKEDVDGKTVAKSKAENTREKNILRSIINKGVTMDNGKHYVFAGQTSSQNKKNVIVLMEESAFNKVRKNMVSGLSADEIEKFNPVKYLANRGTYFTPSNADTGVKVRDAVVVGDVFKTMHNVTRRFLRLDDMRDRKALKQMGLSDEKIEEIIKSTKIGQATLVTGDLVMKATDGTGFIFSDKGESFQFRGPGGLKGLLQAFDFVRYFNDVIPYDPNAEYTWNNDDGEVSGGIRFVDKSKGVEILDKWGTWQSLNGKKALLFDSTVKFAGEFKSSEEFYKKAGDYDIRSVPKENTYGKNPDSGMVEGYDIRGLSQLLRSQTSLSKEDLDALLNENIGDPIRAIMTSPKMQAKLFGVDLDSKALPVTDDINGLLVWFGGENFLKTNFGQKLVSNKIGQIIKQARGGKLYFQKGKSAYQWVAPDPFGITYAMTCMRYQDSERKSFEPDKNRARVENKNPVTFKGYEGLSRGKVYTGTLEKGLTLVGRYPSMEENDVQLRTNEANEFFDTLVEKYGLSPDILYFSVNDELSLNLDNDFDGDATLAAQGALATGIRESRRRAGIDPETGAKLGGVFTEIVHAKADPDFVQDAETIFKAVRAGLKAEGYKDIGQFDRGIDFIQAMSNKMLKPAADKRGLTPKEFRAMLIMDYAAAYKLGVDYTKTGWYPSQFFGIVEGFESELADLAESQGFYIGEEGGKKFRPVPAAYEYSSKKSKREEFQRALAKHKELKAKGYKNNKTILYGSGNILYDLVYAKNDYIPSKDASSIESIDFYRDALQEIYGKKQLDLTSISTVDPAAYTNLPNWFVEKINDTYAEIMKSQGEEGDNSNKHRQELFDKLDKAIEGLDDDQFTSLMIYTLSVNTDRDNWATFFNHPRAKKVLARNLRILGNVGTIDAAIADTQKSISDTQASLEKAEQDLRDYKAELFQEQDFQAEAINLVNELRGVMDQVQEKLGAAEKTKGNYEKKAANSKTIEAAIKNAEGFERYADRVKDLQEKLSIIKEEYDEATAVKDESRSYMEELVGKINALMSDGFDSIDSIGERLTSLKESLDSLNTQMEREATKEWYYGIGTTTVTGLENADLEAIGKRLDSIFAEAGETTATQNAAKRGASEFNNMQEESAPPVDNQQEEPAPTITQPTQQQPSTKAQEKSAPVTESEAPAEAPKKTVDRKITYGLRYGDVKVAANRAASSMGRNATRVIPDSLKEALGDSFGTARRDLAGFDHDFTAAFAAEDDGESLRAFCKRFPEMLRNSGALRAVLGGEDSNVAKAAAAVVDASTNDDHRVDSQFQNAAADFAEMVAKEVEVYPKVRKMLHTWKTNINNRNKTSKFMASDSKFGKLASLFFGYHRDTVNILEGLDDFDPNGDGPGYELAKAIYTNNYKATNILGNSLDTLLTAQSAFEKSGGAKKTVEFDIVKNGTRESHKVSMANAIDFLHTLNTINASRLNAWSNVSYQVGDEHILLSSKEQYLAVEKALKEAISGDAGAKAYYDAFTEGYKMFAVPIKAAVKAASGRTVDLLDERDYYPLLFGKQGTPKGASDFDFGLDGKGFTKRRYKVDGGTVVITDPAERFNRYAHSATNLISRGEVGAMMARLNREGLGETITDIVAERYGKGHTDVIKQFIKDTNSFVDDSPEAYNFLRKIRLNVQAGALFGNFGSMLKQFPSVYNACGVLDFDSITMGAAAALTSASARSKAGSVGAIKSRHQGNLDPSIAEALDTNTGFKRAMEKLKVLKFAKEGFEIVDSLAIKSIYLASEYQVKKDSRYAPGTQQYEDAILDLFVPAFMQTQPQFEKALRPYVQTSSSEFIRVFGMFKTQPLRNFNTMIRTVSEYETVKAKYGKNSKEYKEASRILRNTLAGQASASLMFGILGVLSSLLYHRKKDLEDEYGELDMGKVMSRILMNSAEAYGGMMVFGDSVVKFVIDTGARIAGNKNIHEFYGSGSGSLESIADVVNSIYDFVDSPSVYKVRKTAGYIATVLGIPMNNALAILNSAILYQRDLTGNNEGNYDSVLKMFEKERKYDQSYKDARSFKNAVHLYTTGRADKANALFAKIDFSDEDTVNSCDSELRTLFADPSVQMTAEQFKEMYAYIARAKNISSATVNALAVGIQKSREYYSNTSPKQQKADIEAIDTDGKGKLSQNELYNYYLQHRGEVKTVEALWNAQGWSGDNALWQTYIAKRNQRYDSYALENEGNATVTAAEKRLQALKDDAAYMSQNPTGDPTIAKEIASMRLGDADTDAHVSKYMSWESQKRYTALREAGMGGRGALDLMLGIDALGKDSQASNGYYSQEEIVAYFNRNNESEAYCKALYDSLAAEKGWKKDWDAAKKAYRKS